VKEDATVTLGLKGVPVSAGAGILELSVTAIRVWPGGAWTAIPARSVELVVPEDAYLDESILAQVAAPTRRTLSKRDTTRLLVFTRPSKATFDVLSGSPGSLSVDRAQLG
jgi:hypothetical protein